MDVCNEDGSQGICFHNDGTTKKHIEFESFQVTLPSKNKTMSIGLTEVPGQTGEDVFTALNDVLQSCVDALTNYIPSPENSQLFAELVCFIDKTMTDLGGKNPVFFRLFEELRINLLPQATENWNTLDESAKADLKKVFHLFCKLHLMANFQNHGPKFLQEVEAEAATENLHLPFSVRSVGPPGFVVAVLQPSHTLVVIGMELGGSGILI